MLTKIDETSRFCFQLKLIHPSKYLEITIQQPLLHIHRGNALRTVGFTVCFLLNINHGWLCAPLSAARICPRAVYQALGGKLTC
jgi:hypothetical protein